MSRSPDHAIFCTPPPGTLTRIPKDLRSIIPSRSQIVGGNRVWGSEFRRFRAMTAISPIHPLPPPLVSHCIPGGVPGPRRFCAGWGGRSSQIGVGFKVFGAARASSQPLAAKLSKSVYVLHFLTGRKIIHFTICSPFCQDKIGGYSEKSNPENAWNWTHCVS